MPDKNNKGDVRSCRAIPIYMVFVLIVAGCDNGSSVSALPPSIPIILGDLSISGTKTPLNPVFDPRIQRYSAIEDENAVGSVTLTASASSLISITINGQIAVSDAAFTLDNLTAGDIVRIQVQGSGNQASQTTDYEIVYLPSDFPELTVTVLEAGASTDPLYVNMNGPGNNYIAILDNHGVPTFFRGHPERSMDFKWHAATGERSYARRTGTINQWGRGDNVEQVILDENFVEIDQIETIGLSHTDVHDFLINENNELFLISYDGAIRDLSAFGLSTEEVVEDSVLQIQDRATRQVLFEWNSWGQVPYEDQTTPTPRSEYAHVNSVFEDFDGNVIMSFRTMSQVVKVGRPGGQVIWRLGGRTNQFEFVNDPFSNLCGQHTASRIDDGNILLFDNGQNCWPVVPERGNTTRVAEYRLDEQNMVAELVWSYSQEGVFSLFAGSAQRLPNGNTVIGWGGGTDVFATEVNSAGEKVFEITAFHGETTVVGYRARRYPE